MNKKVRKIWNYLLAGVLTAGIFVTGIPAEQYVSAAQMQTFESEVTEGGRITEFVALDDTVSSIHSNNKIALKKLLEQMPSTIQAYVEGEEKPVKIPVTWNCRGDYENTNYFYYEFDPEWDEDLYPVSKNAMKDIPYIGVFLTRAYGNSTFKLASASSNEKTVYNFLKNDLGVNTAAACGILANIYSESSFNPTASVIDTNGKTSYGICQWNGVRFDALKSYCSQYGYDYKTLNAQLKYLQYELTHSEASAFSKVKNVENTAQGAYTAGYNWARYFERCASVYFESRAKLARDTYWAKYKSDSPDPNPTPDPEAEYKITYYLYDGTNNDENPDTYTKDDDTITLKKPKKTGYSFGGWYTDSTLTNKITQIAAGSTGDISIYAKWIANKYTICFYGNKATSGSVANMNCEYDGLYTLRANKFKRTGYKFNGWNTQTNGKGDSYKNKEEIENLATKDGSTVKLYAQWKRITYKINYQLKGGKLSDDVRTKYNVATGTFKLEKPKRTGYTFLGWYKEKNYKTSITRITKGSTGNVTVYAKWSKNSYKVRYKGNKATSGSMNNIMTCNYGSKYTLASNKFKRTDYIFTGWNTRADGSGKSYANRATIKNLSAKNNATITLYAQWKKKSYQINYELNGGMMLDENPTTYYADTKTFKLKAPAREGYTFGGWYTEPNFKHKVTQIKKGTRKNYTLYAKWTINTYTVQFDGNGATGGTTAALSCEYGKPYTLTANGFVREGYRFVGWSMAPDGTGTFYGDLVQIQNLSTGNGTVITLYAQWEAL